VETTEVEDRLASRLETPTQWVLVLQLKCLKQQRRLIRNVIARKAIATNAESKDTSSEHAPLKAERPLPGR